ncbi:MULTISPECIES: LysE family translocator [unclassified Halomonas]|uniref:LysE family translocator n=1 Tax=unclassified Halomonas TaxID=2609666 RepID=UPI001CF12E99|nr:MULTISPECIES: LysE family translocator [unclassified Halomonas]MCA8864620.1 LysE family translocator [Halomonas sp. SBBP1]UZH12017.1 LysE family translocator [Halomonas sp. BDJS001]
MVLTDYLLFAMIAAMQVGSPGPSTILLVNNALVHGPSRAILILTGDLVAIAGLAACSLLGVGALLEANPTVFMVVKVVGAVYLLWLGMQQFRMAQAVPTPSGQPTTLQSVSVLWRQSFMVGLSNPKAILFFSSLLPQFISSQQDSHIATLLPLILLFVFIKLIVSSAYALAAQTVITKLAKPGAAVWGKRAAGGVLMLFGIFMAINAFY